MDALSAWTLLAAALGLLYWLTTRNHDVFRRQGVPGPRPLPFLGTMLGYIRGVWKYDMECFEKYGTMWGLLDGQVPSLVVMDREFVRSVMVKEFWAGFVNRRFLGPGGALRSGLTIAKDEAWRRLRALLSPTFTGARLREMFPVAERRVDALVQHLAREAGRGGRVRVRSTLAAFSTDVLVAAAFSADLDSLRRPRDPFVEKARKLLRFDFLSPFFLAGVLFLFLEPVFDLLNVSMFPRDSVEFFRAFLERAKEQHREPGRENRVDFLQLMLNAQEHAKEPGKALTDSEILAQSIFFIFAGYDTTSSTLAFMLHALATRPHVQARLQAAVDAALPGGAPPTYQSLEALDYVDMVVSETLRLYPVCSRVDRVCGRDVTLHGVSLPRGAVVTVPVYALHHDPARWPEPEDFRPERFSPEHRAAIDPYNYLPFGCGPRNCIGRRFALMTMKLALTRLVQRFSFRPCEETQIPLQLGREPNLHPAKPIILRVVSREA